jgi:hypothetical protein
MRVRPYDTLLLRLLSLAIACGGGDTSAPSRVQPSAVSLDVVSGGDQSALIGQTLPAPLVVRITARVRGVPAAGMVVNWIVVTGAGSMFVTATQTDNKGETRNWWTLGTSPGDQQVQVRAVDPTTGERLVFASVNAHAAVPQCAITLAAASGGTVSLTSGTATGDCGRGVTVRAAPNAMCPTSRSRGRHPHRRSRSRRMDWWRACREALLARPRRSAESLAAYRGARR